MRELLKQLPSDAVEQVNAEIPLDKCNTLVVGLLREALVAQGRAALGRLSGWSPCCSSAWACC